MDPTADITIGRARRGDGDAFRILVERYARSVFRVAYRMTTDRNDAEDIVQETMLKAWKQIGKFDDRASFATWLHRICVNCCFDLLRRRETRKAAAMPEFHEFPSGNPSPERLAESSEITARLLPALDELTTMERAAFILRHYEGVSIEEIANTLGVAPGAARHTIFRAVQKLRRALEPMAVTP